MKTIRHESRGVQKKRQQVRPGLVFCLSAAVLAVLILILFADIVTGEKEIVFSKGGDIRRQVAYWRDFGFGQIRNGNIPLWNPHIFSGVPFLAGPTSALLYPPNLLFLLFDLSTAINITTALHIYLLGVFTFLWTWRRGIHPVGCLFASTIIICCGAHMTHVYAGHVKMLCAMAWAPLILLVTDQLWVKPSLKWFLIGCLAVAMQILAAHPQTVFYGAVTIAIYSILHIFKARGRITIPLMLGGMYVAGVLLAAAQLLPTYEATKLTVRSGSIPFEVVSSTSLPPENIVTAVVPGFLGDNEAVRYWGQWYYWEVSAFLGIIGLGLATYGSIYGHRDARRYSLWMCMILMVLALGSHTPLLRILYAFVPGFNKFRVSARFLFFLSLFVANLSAVGAAQLIAHRPSGKKAVLIVLAVAVLLSVAALCIRISLPSQGRGVWREIVKAVSGQSNSAATHQLGEDSSFVNEAGAFASRGLFIASGLCLLLTGLVFLRRYWAPAAYLVLIAGAVELLVFAHSTRGSFDLRRTRPAGLLQFLREQPVGD